MGLRQPKGIDTQKLNPIRQNKNPIACLKYSHFSFQPPKTVEGRGDPTLEFRSIPASF